MRQHHNKLVRDRIPEIIQQAGLQSEVVVMSEGEYRQALREKLLEEAQEAATANPHDLVGELADLQEAIEALSVAYGIERDKIFEVQRRKRSERGGFERRLRLLWTQTPQND
jgi:predicted house-cleaning noncanonical NTP pyrophosphatase (MazG superfamily)